MSLTSLGVTTATLNKFNFYKSNIQLKEGKKWNNDEFISLIIDRLLKEDSISFPLQTTPNSNKILVEED